MSKFCKNCGASLNDETMFCHSCGARQDAPVEQAAPVTPNEAPAPKKAKANPMNLLNKITKAGADFIEKKNISKKQLAIAGGILGGIIVAIIVILLLIPNPQPAIDNYEAVINGKVSKVEKLAPEEYWTYAAKQADTSKSKYMDEYMDNYEEEYDEMVENWEDEYGKNPKVTIDILNKESQDKDVVEGVAEALHDQYKIDEKSVKNVYDLIIKMTIKGSDDSDTNGTNMSAVQIGSSWYLISYYESDGDYSVRFVLP